MVVQVVPSPDSTQHTEGDVGGRLHTAGGPRGNHQKTQSSYKEGKYLTGTPLSSESHNVSSTTEVK